MTIKAFAKENTFKKKKKKLETIPGAFVRFAEI